MMIRLAKKFCTGVSVLVLMTGCSSYSGRNAEPINSNREVEHLVFDDGGIPRWEKTGEVSVKSQEN